MQSARTSSHVYCALLSSIDVCFVSRPPRFVTLIAWISIQHVPGVKYKMESNWTPWWYAGRGGEGWVSKHVADGRRLNWRLAENKEIVTRWSNSTQLSRQNCLRLISDAWIQISKGWKTNTNSNLKLEVRKSELCLTTLVFGLFRFIHFSLRYKN